MKYLKKYNSFNESTDTFSGYYDSECLKSRLRSYYQEQESEYDPEETSNVIDILNEYDDSLTGLNGLDKTLLLRLINDDELYQEVDALSNRSDDDRNVFDSVQNNFNEEISFKGLVAGVMSLLATSCSNVDIYDKTGEEVEVSNYISNGKVENITSHYRKGYSRSHVGYQYTIFDDKGYKVIIELDNDVVSIGDSVKVDIEYGQATLIMKEEDCKDPSNCFPLPHNHIKGDNRSNPE